MLHVSKFKLFAVLLVCLLSIYLSIPTFFPKLAESKYANLFAGYKVNLGLDLQGGAYIMLEVDFNSYEREQIQKFADQVRMFMRKDNIDISNLVIKDQRISFEIKDITKINEANKTINNALNGAVTIKSEGNIMALTPDEAAFKSMRHDLMMQTIEIVRRRLDESGTKELDIQRQGSNYILVQVPGLNDPEQIKRLLGKTAKLSLHLVDDTVSINEALQGRIPVGTKILPLEDKTSREQQRYIVIQSRAIVTGDMLVDAKVSININNPVVSFRFNNIGAKIFGDVTTQSTGKQLAIVLDNKVISAPVINEPILGGNGQISGNFTVQSANELALLLRAGALPVPLKVAEERTVGPSLGLDSIESGTKAAIIGTLAVILFMFLFYSLFGMIANFALIFNLLLTISILALFGATLTMPGIAGMVLALGMAVDANVLIFERIKEELRKGRTPLASIESGYNLAFSTIMDSNLTTLITTFILFIFGSGPVKGFAVTISVGIICSMFTAIVLSKIVIAYWYRFKRPNYLPL
jgi:preprotein translocase subunit SecD